MDIQLAGMAFDESFLAFMPELERKMVFHGYEPAQFLFEKHARPAPYPSVGRVYDYTVTVDGKTFTLPFGNDMEFLTYINDACFSESYSEKPTASEKLVHLFQRFEKWLTATPPDEGK